MVFFIRQRISTIRAASVARVADLQSVWSFVLVVRGWAEEAVVYVEWLIFTYRKATDDIKSIYIGSRLSEFISFQVIQTL